MNSPVLSLARWKRQDRFWFTQTIYDVDVDYLRGSVRNMVVFLAVDTLNELILFPPSL